MASPYARFLHCSTVAGEAMLTCLIASREKYGMKHSPLFIVGRIEALGAYGHVWPSKRIVMNVSPLISVISFFESTLVGPPGLENVLLIALLLCNNTSAIGSLLSASYVELQCAAAPEVAAMRS